MFQCENAWRDERESDTPPHTMRTTTFACIVFFAACGGAQGAATTTPTAAGETAGPSWSERAVSAYTQSDLEAAWRASQNALQLDATDTHAMEVAARVSLSRLDAERTLVTLEHAHGPTLLRLRARANALRGDYASVARDLAAVEGQEPADGWATAMLPLARAAGAGPFYTLTGSATAEISYEGAAATMPIPIIAVSIDGHATNALIATSASTTVIDDDGHPTGTVLSDLGMGAVHMHGVPAFARDLGDIERAVGMPIGAVIGTDILFRLHATLDGPGRKLLVRATASQIPPDALTLPFRMFEGSLLAVQANLNDGAPQYYVLDSAAGLVLALANVAVESMHLNVADLPEVPGSPVPNARVVDIETFHLGAAAIEHVPGVTELVPPHLAEIAGLRIYGVIGSQFLGQFQVTFDTENKSVALWVDGASQREGAE